MSDSPNETTCGAYGRRAARHAERPESALRRLLPQALVVAFLAGGTTALAAQDNAIEPRADGRPRTLRAFADSAPGQPGARTGGAYLSVSRSERIGRAGLAHDIRTGPAATITAAGRARTEHAGATADPKPPGGTEGADRTGWPGARRVTYVLRTVDGVQRKVRKKPSRERAEAVRKPSSRTTHVGKKRPRPVAHVGKRPPRPVARVDRKTPPRRTAHVGKKRLRRSVARADGLNWRALAVCESGGRTRAVDPSGTYGGLYQFDSRTWHGLGGKGRPQDASAAEQTYRAKKLYLRRGTRPWPHCGPRLHR